MVQVPITPQRRVQVQPLGNERLQYGAARNLVGPAIEDFGRAVSQTGEGLDQIEATYDQADVLNLDNTFAGEASAAQAEFGNLRGDQPGRVLQDQVKALQDRAEQLTSGARSERATNMVRRALAVRVQNARERMTAHSDTEMLNFRDGALVAGRNQAVNDAITQAGTPQFDVAVGTGLTRLEERAKLQGWAPEQAALERSKFLDEVHGGVVDHLFAVPDPDINAIGKYLEDNGAAMTPALRAEVLKRLQQPLQGRVARSDADLAMGLAGTQEHAPAAPADAPAAHLDTITARAESGGHEFRADGGRVTSPVGARGLMQVMPATAAAPGFGLRASNGTPEDDARLGREYRATMERRYGGDLAKMWAAYNWGPGNVDKAIAQHGDQWLDHAPAETRRYVLGNVAAAGGAGTGYDSAPRQWDRTAITKALETTAEREGWTPERADRARQEVERRVDRDEGLLKSQRNDADDQVAAFVQAHGAGFTSTAQIPRALWNTLEPRDKMKWESAATANLNDTKPKANSTTAMALSRMAIEKPADFAGLNLARYAPNLTPAELEQFNSDQARAKVNLAKPPGTNPREAIDAAISRGAHWEGVKVDDPKDPSGGLRVRRYMEIQADEFVATTKKQPSPDDYQRWFRQAATHERSSKLSPTFQAVIEREYRQSHGGRSPSQNEINDIWAQMGKPEG